jgi:hypothetical protein
MNGNFIYHLVLLSELNIVPQVAAYTHIFLDHSCMMLGLSIILTDTVLYSIIRTQCYVFCSDVCNPSPGKAAIERQRNVENVWASYLQETYITLLSHFVKKKKKIC